MINYATSNIHDTVFGIKNIMRGGSSMNITQIIYNKKEFLVKSSFLFITATLVPFLPSGSFFTSYGATIFFINYSPTTYPRIFCM